MGRESRLAFELKAYVKDTNRTGEITKKTIPWLCQKLGIKRATYYARLADPDSFSPFERERLAELLDVSVDEIMAMGKDFGAEKCDDSSDNEDNNKKMSELVQGFENNKDLIESEESKMSTEQSVLGTLGINPTGLLAIFLLVSAVIATLAIVTGGNGVADGMSRKSPEVEYIAHLSGVGEDLSPAEFSQITNLHKKLYKYEFKDFIVRTVGEEITMEGTATWVDIEGSRKLNEFKIVATGKHVGDTAALSYTASEDPEGDVWVGVMLLHLPRSGPASGYWTTLHNDKGVGEGPFAIGTIDVIRNSPNDKPKPAQ
ncbi:hypothetical protein ACSLBF_16805 [Pseudoalteromonas sp. T1lg65]|uniref:hypothetical protein n=1 Tax=Pseudoalteromonas sp. T1lg65 TaxID=2077101 RepID=UPI003F7A95B8